MKTLIRIAQSLEELVILTKERNTMLRIDIKAENQFRENYISTMEETSKNLINEFNIGDTK